MNEDLKDAPVFSKNKGNLSEKDILSLRESDILTSRLEAFSTDSDGFLIRTNCPRVRAAYSLEKWGGEIPLDLEPAFVLEPKIKAAPA